jgi:hypothetical protein
MLFLVRHIYRRDRNRRWVVAQSAMPELGLCKGIAGGMKIDNDTYEEQRGVEWCYTRAPTAAHASRLYFPQNCPS